MNKFNFLFVLFSFLGSHLHCQILTINTVNLKEISWLNPSSEILLQSVYKTKEVPISLSCMAKCDAQLVKSDFTVFVDGVMQTDYEASCENNVFTFKINFSAEKDYILKVSAKKGKAIVSTSELKIERPFIGKRFALLLGNTEYTDNNSLKNQPIIDVNIISQSLKSRYFNTHTLNNLTRVQILDSLDTFVTQAQGSDIIFFYYAGHGIQHEGKNFIIPVDAKLKSKSDINTRTIEVQFIINKLEEANPKCKIVVLDACRNELFPMSTSDSRGVEESRGFSPIRNLNISTHKIGSYIVNATQPNQTAANDGMFAKELSSMLLEGKTIAEVFRKLRSRIWMLSKQKQEPEINDKLTEDITF